MEHPQDELRNIVPRLLSVDSPDTQKETVLKYFTENASFSHPLCRVESAPNSRNDILSIYQSVFARFPNNYSPAHFRFYRFLSPKIEVEILSVGKCTQSCHHDGT